MTSKEIESRSGVPRANIRYYEAEGLLTPQRLKNGYRSYSEEDLAQLERIRQSGAVVRWIRPYTWRQEEQYRRAGLERTAGQEQIDAGKGQPQAIYRGQIIEWRLEG